MRLALIAAQTSPVCSTSEIPLLLIVHTDCAGLNADSDTDELVAPTVVRQALLADVQLDDAAGSVPHNCSVAATPPLLYVNT